MKNNKVIVIMILFILVVGFGAGSFGTSQNNEIPSNCMGIKLILDDKAWNNAYVFADMSKSGERIQLEEKDDTGIYISPQSKVIENDNFRLKVYKEYPSNTDIEYIYVEYIEDDEWQVGTLKTIENYTVKYNMEKYEAAKYNIYPESEIYRKGESISIPSDIRVAGGLYNGWKTESGEIVNSSRYTVNKKENLDINIVNYDYEGDVLQDRKFSPEKIIEITSQTEFIEAFNTHENDSIFKVVGDVTVDGATSQNFANTYGGILLISEDATLTFSNIYVSLKNEFENCGGLVIESGGKVIVKDNSELVCGADFCVKENGILELNDGTVKVGLQGNNCDFGFVNRGILELKDAGSEVIISGYDTADDDLYFNNSKNGTIDIEDGRFLIENNAKRDVYYTHNEEKRYLQNNGSINCINEGEFYINYSCSSMLCDGEDILDYIAFYNYGEMLFDGDDKNAFGSGIQVIKFINEGEITLRSKLNVSACDFENRNIINIEDNLIEGLSLTRDIDRATCRLINNEDAVIKINTENEDAIGMRIDNGCEFINGGKLEVDNALRESKIDSVGAVFSGKVINTGSIINNGGIGFLTKYEYDIPSISGNDIEGGIILYGIKFVGKEASSDENISEVKYTSGDFVKFIDPAWTTDIIFLPAGETQQITGIKPGYKNVTKEIVAPNSIDESYFDEYGEGAHATKEVLYKFYEGESIDDDFVGNTLSKKNIDNAYKEWTVKFNQKILASSITKSNIYIKDEMGNNLDVDIKIGEDKKSIIITPKEAYETNKKYYIYVTKGIMPENGNEMKQNLRMPFILE